MWLINLVCHGYQRGQLWNGCDTSAPSPKSSSFYESFLPLPIGPCFSLQQTVSVVLSFVVIWLLRHVQLFWDPMDYSPPGSSVHGILQARILEWLAVSFSRGSSWPWNWTWVSCIGRYSLLSVALPNVKPLPSFPVLPWISPDISEEADLSAAPGLPWFTLTNQSNPTLPTQWVVYKWARGPIPANEIRDICWRLLRAFLIFMRVTGSQLLLSYWKRIREHTAHNAAGIRHKHSGVTNLGQGC